MMVMLNLWADSFKMDTIEDVYKAVGEYIMGSKFAPTIAEVRELMMDAAPVPHGDYAAIEAAFMEQYQREAIG